MKNSKRIRIVARYVGAVMILLSVFLTWLRTSFGWKSLLQLAAEAGEGFLSGFLSAPIFVIFITFFLVIVGVVAALIPTQIAIWDYIVPKTEIGSRSYAIARHSKFVAVSGGILPLIGVGVLMLFQVSTDPSGVRASFDLGVFVAILGAAVVIASVAIPGKRDRAWGRAP